MISQATVADLSAALDTMTAERDTKVGEAKALASKVEDISAELGSLKSNADASALVQTEAAEAAGALQAKLEEQESLLKASKEKLQVAEAATAKYAESGSDAAAALQAQLAAAEAELKASNAKLQAAECTGADEAESRSAALAALQAKLVEREEELKTFAERLEAGEAAVAAEKETGAELRAALDQAKEDHAAGAAAALAAKAKSDADIASFEGKVTAMAAELDSLKAQADAAEKVAAAQGDGAAERSAQLATSQAAETDARKEAARLQEEVGALTAANIEAVTEAKQHQATAAEANKAAAAAEAAAADAAGKQGETIQQLTADLQRSAAEHEEATSQIAKELNAAKAERDDEAAATTKAEGALAELAKEKAELEAANVELQTSNETLQAAEAEAATQAASGSETTAALQAKLDAVQAAKDKAEANAEKVLAELELEKGKVAEAGNVAGTQAESIQQLKADLEKTTKERDTVTATKQKLQTKAKEIIVEYKATKEKLAGAEAEASQQVGKVSALTTELESVKAKAEAAEKVAAANGDGEQERAAQLAASQAAEDEARAEAARLQGDIDTLKVDHGKTVAAMEDATSQASAAHEAAAEKLEAELETAKADYASAITAQEQTGKEALLLESNLADLYSEMASLQAAKDAAEEIAAAKGSGEQEKSKQLEALQVAEGEARLEISRLQGEVDALGIVKQEATGTANEQQARVAQLEADLAAATDATHAANKSLEEAHDELETETARLEEAEAALQASNIKLQAAEAAAANQAESGTEAAARLQAKLDAAEAARDAVEAKAKESLAELELEQGKVVEAEEVADKLVESIQQLTADLEKANTERDAVTATKQKLQAKAKEIIVEYKATKGKLAGAEAEVAAHMQSALEYKAALDKAQADLAAAGDAKEKAEGEAQSLEGKAAALASEVEAMKAKVEAAEQVAAAKGNGEEERATQLSVRFIFCLFIQGFNLFSRRPGSLSSLRASRRHTYILVSWLFFFFIMHYVCLPGPVHLRPHRQRKARHALKLCVCKQRSKR